jgi:hypothetical protein
MTLVTGSRLGPYEIVVPLGAGDIGVFCRARDPLCPYIAPLYQRTSR